KNPASFGCGNALKRALAVRMSPEEFLARFPDHPESEQLRAQGIVPGTGRESSSSAPRKKARKSSSSAGGPSHLEALFEQHLLAMKAPKPEREHRFHPERGWRMDFAWPE